MQWSVSERKYSLPQPQSSLSVIVTFALAVICKGVSSYILCRLYPVTCSVAESPPYHSIADRNYRTTDPQNLLRISLQLDTAHVVSCTV